MLKSKLIICLLAAMVLAGGCAGVGECLRGFWGTSTRALEKARKDAITKDFRYDYFSCYTRTLDILQKIKAYVYAKDINKQMIAFYVSENDTTSVAIFFREIGKNNTRLEVSSLSQYAKELIASKVFSALDPSSSKKK